MSKEIEIAREYAHTWVFETNGHRWSNNNNECGDNFESYLKGYEQAHLRTKELEEDFIVWCLIHAQWDRRNRLTWKGDGKAITVNELKDLYEKQKNNNI